MKRYLVFLGSMHYPSEGMGDFIGDADSIDDANSLINEEVNKRIADGYDSVYKYTQIYDTFNRKEV
jgi:hypothetical protein